MLTLTQHPCHSTPNGSNASGADHPWRAALLRQSCERCGETKVVGGVGLLQSWNAGWSQTQRLTNETLRWTLILRTNRPRLKWLRVLLQVLMVWRRRCLNSVCTATSSSSRSRPSKRSTRPKQKPLPLWRSASSNPSAVRVAWIVLYIYILFRRLCSAPPVQRSSGLWRSAWPSPTRAWPLTSDPLTGWTHLFFQDVTFCCPELWPSYSEVKPLIGSNVKQQMSAWELELSSNQNVFGPFLFAQMKRSISHPGTYSFDRWVFERDVFKEFL